MSKCQFDLLNKSSMSNGVSQVYYMPYSVSTLKISIKNFEEKPIKVIIRPKEYSNNDDYCGGFVDDRSPGIEISWGGGNKKGTIISLDPNQTKYAFLFINHHSTTEPAFHSLTVEAEIKVGGYGAKYKHQRNIDIMLVPLSTGKDVIHEIPNDSSTIFEGGLLGNYSPRWFPPVLDPSNHYSAVRIPNLQIRIERKKMRYREDRVIVTIDHNDVGIIAGDMDGASFYANLFKFDENIYVLRMWFFWLSKSQFKKKENLKTIKIKERWLDFPPELPDSERYDLMFSGNGKILGVGTDYHWQEYWCELKSTTLNGVIAFPLHDYFGLLKLLEEKIKKFITKGRYDYAAIINDLRSYSRKPIWRSVDLGLDTDKPTRYDNYSKETIERDIRQRGLQVFRSHVPIIQNGKLLPDMLSARVDANV